MVFHSLEITSKSANVADINDMNNYSHQGIFWSGPEMLVQSYTSFGGSYLTWWPRNSLLSFYCLQ